MKEIWKDVSGYEGIYQISNFGRVRSFKFSNVRILKNIVHSAGYLTVDLRKNGTRKSFKIHRLVALAFIENPNNLPSINHKDECKTNNSINNLEWCTDKYNTNYGTRTERTSKPVIQFIDQVELSRFDSLHDAAIKTNLPLSSISKCCTGKMKKCGGFTFEFCSKRSTGKRIIELLSN